MIEKYVDAEELKRLLSTLVIILGCIVIGALFASIVVPGLRNANQPATPTAVAPVVGESGWLDPTEFPLQKGALIPPVDPKTLITASPELLSRGKELFDLNCISCHGESGRGDGPAAATMNPHPRNFTSPEVWTNGFETPDMFKTVTQGISGTSMAPFDYLSKRDRMALVHYVQSLGKFHRKGASPESLEALSRELGSPGEKTPNKIPVSLAIAKLAEESANLSPIAPGPQDESPEAELLRRAVVDPSRAARTLGQSGIWHTSPRDLAGYLLPGVPGNGFSVRLATWEMPEWQALHAELLKRIQSK
jgi:mono/diheme cytochrome c family protein